jgi:hypothetical protein
MAKKSKRGVWTESADTPILIKAYGEFWNPDVANWERTWRLMGTRRSDSGGPNINVYEERGVYVLYKDFVPVYVGKADKQSIGYRLQLHRESERKGPRWDRFSWFGIRGLKKNGKLRLLRTAAHSPTPELIATLEALLIIVIDPRLNARRERFKNAILLYQSEVDKPMDTSEHLQSIEQKLDSVLNLYNRKSG